MTSTADSDVARLQNEMQQLREDFAKVASTLGDLARHRAGECSAGLAGEAKQSVEHAWTQAKERVEGIAGEIESRPLGSALVAFFAGILIGLLFIPRRG